jgi:hypothetical protein
MSGVDLLVFKSNNYVYNNWAVEEQVKALRDAIKVINI